METTYKDRAHDQVPAQREVMILVQPGSLCGSANSNLSLDIASAIRADVASDIESWEGDLIVLDGFLSDEIPHYRVLDLALRAALEDDGGRRRVRLDADDPDHAEIAVEYLSRVGYPKGTPISLTGAWFDEADQEGCVNATRDALTNAGFTNVQVLDSAARVDEYHYIEDEAVESDAPGMNA